MSATRLPLIDCAIAMCSGCDRSDSGYLSPSSIGESPAAAIVIVRSLAELVRCVLRSGRDGTVPDLERSVSCAKRMSTISGG